jgi:hypothetical protein
MTPKLEICARLREAAEPKTYRRATRTARTPYDAELMEGAAALIETLVEALFDLALKAGKLGVALDGQEKYRRLRADVVESMEVAANVLRAVVSEDSDRRSKAVSSLLAMHEKMLRAVQAQKPYPVSVECGKSDLQSLLSAIVELERATAVIAALAAQNDEPPLSPYPETGSGDE